MVALNITRPDEDSYLLGQGGFEGRTIRADRRRYHPKMKTSADKERVWKSDYHQRQPYTPPNKERDAEAPDEAGWTRRPPFLTVTMI